MRKRLGLVLILLAACVSIARAQTSPVGAYTFNSGAWSPFVATGGTTVSFVPPPASLYCYLPGSPGGWVPWTAANCGGGASTGTVTSVALVGSGNLFSATAGSAVTAAGTLNVDAQLFAQTANCVVAGPSSGAAASPTCRALVAGDLPSAIPVSKIGTSGATGTGALVLMTSPTLAAPTLTGATTTGAVTASGPVTSSSQYFGPILGFGDSTLEGAFSGNSPNITNRGIAYWANQQWPLGMTNYAIPSSFATDIAQNQSAPNGPWRYGTVGWGLLHTGLNDRNYTSTLQQAQDLKAQYFNALNWLIPAEYQWRPPSGIFATTGTWTLNTTRIGANAPALEAAANGSTISFTVTVGTQLALFWELIDGNVGQANAVITQGGSTVGSATLNSGNSGGVIGGGNCVCTTIGTTQSPQAQLFATTPGTATVTLTTTGISSGLFSFLGAGTNLYPAGVASAPPTLQVDALPNNPTPSNDNTIDALLNQGVTTALAADGFPVTYTCNIAADSASFAATANQPSCANTPGPAGNGTPWLDTTYSQVASTSYSGGANGTATVTLTGVAPATLAAGEKVTLSLFTYEPTLATTSYWTITSVTGSGTNPGIVTLQNPNYTGTTAWSGVSETTAQLSPMYYSNPHPNGYGYYRWWEADNVYFNAPGGGNPVSLGQGFNLSQIPSDTVCAAGGDTTVASVAITGESWSAGVLTFTTAAVPLGYVPNLINIDVTGANVSGYNQTNVPIFATAGNNFTVLSATNPGTSSAPYGSGNLHCNNTSDAITATAFQNSLTIPAYYWNAGVPLTATSSFAMFTPSTAPPIVLTLLDGGTTLATTGSIALGGGVLNYPGLNAWKILANTQSRLFTNELSYSWNASGSFSTFVNSTRQPVTVTSNVAESLTPEVTFSAGIKTMTYTSGGTFAGTGTCALSAISTGTGVVASLTITANVPGAWTVTTRGYSASGTTANVTAWGTCTGTATAAGTAANSITLGGALGTMLVQNYMTSVPQ